MLEYLRGRLEDWKDNAKYMRKRGRLGELENNARILERKQGRLGKWEDIARRLERKRGRMKQSKKC